jgi:hypothetical protein
MQCEAVNDGSMNMVVVDSMSKGPWALTIIYLGAGVRAGPVWTSAHGWW